jgi:hypothetical protein
MWPKIYYVAKILINIYVLVEVQVLESILHVGF